MEASTEIISDPLNGIENKLSTSSILKRVYEEVTANYKDEKLTVESLAYKMGMSRSQLHRKLKLACGLSANQFIRAYRLKKSLELLSTEDTTISEVAYEVGFGSPSYFTECFTDFYGYPPGEAKARLRDISQSLTSTNPASDPVIIKKPFVNRRYLFLISTFVILGLIVIYAMYQKSASKTSDTQFSSTEKSIAVLPFKNLNASRENEYFSLGVIDAINRYLSGINDLRIISQTTTNRYKKQHQIGQGNSRRTVGLLPFGRKYSTL